MNIVLIISDTFRSDHVGCYGNDWIRTPNLDRLARKAITFDRAYAASFPTVPARADLLTGKFTFTYRGWQPLSQEEITLPQLLTEAGYTTMGIVDTPFYMRNGYGYDRGFEDFLYISGQAPGPGRDDSIYQRRYEEDHFAPMTMSAAERWLERHADERFFLLVDTWDPHEPWDPPSHYVKMYWKDHDEHPAPYPSYWDWKEAGLSREHVRRAHAHYCGQVTMVDRWIGRLLEKMEILGLMENTAVIFASDHGFYFGEHGMFGKGMVRNEPGAKAFQGKWYRSPLYEEVTRIPLLIYLPGVEPARVDALVAFPDLMPTIMELAGLERPEFVQAVSVMPLIRGKRSKQHDLIVTSWPLYNVGQQIRVVDDFERRLEEPLPSTVSDGEWSLIYATSGEPVELYHTLSDPEQRENLADTNEAKARELHKKFTNFLEEMGTDEVFLTPRKRIY